MEEEDDLCVKLWSGVTPYVPPALTTERAGPPIFLQRLTRRHILRLR